MSTQRDNAKIDLDKIIPFYQKGNIPMISEKRACEKIVELVRKNSKIREIPVDRRSSPSVLYVAHFLNCSQSDLCRGDITAENTHLDLS